MNRQVNRQVEKEVLRTQAERVLARHADTDRPIPDRGRLALVPRITRLAQECPVQVHVNARWRLVERRMVVGNIELEAVRIRQPPVTEAAQETVDAPDVLAMDEQIEITARTDSRMAVQRFCQHRTLERDHGNPLALELFEKMPELAAHDHVTRGRLGKIALKPLPHGERHVRRRIALAGEREGGSEPFGVDDLKQQTPIERLMRNGRRVGAREGAQARDDEAGLGAQRASRRRGRRCSWRPIWEAATSRRG